MRILKVKNHLSESKLREIMESQKLIRDFKDWQIIHSVSNNYGKKASEIATILGVTESKIYKAVQRYNKLKKNLSAKSLEFNCYIS